MRLSNQAFQNSMLVFKPGSEWYLYFKLNVEVLVCSFFSKIVIWPSNNPAFKQLQFR